MLLRGTYYARLLRQAKAQTITGYDPTTDDQEVGNHRDMSFDTAEFLQQLVSLSSFTGSESSITV